MGDEETRLLEYRVAQLEAVEAALRVEVHDLRTELQASLRSDFMTRAELMNKFVPREELAARGRVQREWWPIAVSTIVGLAAIANLILTIAGHR